MPANDSDALGFRVTWCCWLLVMLGNAFGTQRFTYAYAYRFIHGSFRKYKDSNMDPKILSSF